MKGQLAKVGHGIRVAFSRPGKLDPVPEDAVFHGYESRVSNAGQALVLVFPDRIVRRSRSGGSVSISMASVTEVSTDGLMIRVTTTSGKTHVFQFPMERGPESARARFLRAVNDHKP